MPVVQDKYPTKKSVVTCIKRPTSAKGAKLNNKVIPAQAGRALYNSSACL